LSSVINDISGPPRLIQTVEAYSSRITDEWWCEPSAEF
jgi:hypothetical protein